jgi:hypothetical protein
MFDVLGVTLASLALLAICYGLVEGQRYEWGTIHGLLSADVFTQGYVLAVRWTMVMPIAVVALAAVSCLAIRNGTGGPAGPAASADSGQMAGAISSPGASGNSPGSSSGTTS